MTSSDSVMGLRGLRISIGDYVSLGNNDLVSSRPDSDVTDGHEGSPSENIYVKVFHNEGF